MQAIGVAENDSAEFSNQRGAGTIKTNDTALIRALGQLGRAWPGCLHFDSLLEGAESPHDRDAVEELAANLLKLAVNGLVDLRTHPGRLAKEIGARPKATSVARLQSRDGQLITTLLHNNVDVDDEKARYLLELLDGMRSEADLALILASRFPGFANVDEYVDVALSRFHKMGLLLSGFDVQVRRAALSDADALSRLAGALFPLGCPPGTGSEDLAAYIDRELNPEKFLELLEDPMIVISIAAVGDELAGYALMARNAAPSALPVSARCELRKFYVDARYHGQGIAGLLMQEVLKIAHEEPDGALWLSVFSENDRAIAFYQKWGFHIAGTQDFWVGSDRQKDYLMLHCW